MNKKLQKVEIEVVEFGEHAVPAIFNNIFRKTHKPNVVKLRIKGIYGEGFLQLHDLNLMAGDSVEIEIIKRK